MRVWLRFGYCLVGGVCLNCGLMVCWLYGFTDLGLMEGDWCWFDRCWCLVGVGGGYWSVWVRSCG